MKRFSPTTPRDSVLCFIVIGGIGFCVDGGLLTLLAQLYQLDVYLARVLSFSVATLVTWRLNRVFVFADAVGPETRKSAEYGRYLIVQTGAAMANLLAFSALIAIYSPIKAMPIVPLFFGAIFGMVFNFSGARYWVFVKRRGEEINA